MRELLIVVLASGLCLVGCGQTAHSPGALANPAAPTPALQSTAGATAAPVANAGVPFHSELTWTKVINGGDPGPCEGLHGNPPAGTIYLMRNTNTAQAVSTHLGAGDYENHTCVYGSIVNGKPSPAGWFADIRWTAANGDVLLATSEFQRWTGTPGKSIAIDAVTFHDGGTGRFAFASGEGTAYVNAPERTAVYEGTLRYGKKDK